MSFLSIPPSRTIQFQLLTPPRLAPNRDRAQVKFRDKIGTSVMDEMQQKLARLRLPSSLSVRTGLIYEGELHPDIETSDHFEFLLPFGDLLGVD